MKKEGPVQETSLLKDDKIPTFLSEPKVDNDVFIPDAPTNGDATKTLADPFAAADMVNASKEEVQPSEPPRKSSGLSLFERVTGVARGNKRRQDNKSEIAADQFQTGITSSSNSINSISSPAPISGIKDIEESVPQAISETGIIEEATSQVIGDTVLVEDASPDLKPKANVELEPISKNDVDANPRSGIDANAVIDGEPESVQNSGNDSAAEDDTNPQTLLGDSDPNDRPSQEEDQEDVLDIPAFLRRQAN